MRTFLREKGLRKPPGISWIVVRSQIHSFVVVNRSHPMADKIYANLISLLHSMKEIGYVPDFVGYCTLRRSTFKVQGSS